MKKIFSILTFIFIFWGVALGQQKSVAVYVIGNEWSDNVTALEGAIIKELSLTGKFRVADRSDAIEAVLSKEYSVQSSGAVNIDQIMKLGMRIGAEYLLVADAHYDSFDSKTNIVAKLINVEENAVVGAADWNGILVESNAPKAAKSIVRDILKKISSNSKKPVVVGPLTFQEVIDYDIPKGYSALNEGANRFIPSEIINKLYDADIYFGRRGYIVVSRTITKSNNRVYETLYVISNYMRTFSDYKERSSLDSDKDYFSYSYPDGATHIRESYNLEFDKKGNFRYIDSKGKKLGKNVMPEGDYYIILIPDN